MAMETTIGATLAGSRTRSTAAAVLALLLVAADFWLVWNGEKSYLGRRGALAICVPLVYLVLARGDLDTVGLRWRPLGSVRYWLCATLAIAAVIALGLLAAGGLYLAFDWEIPVITTHPRAFWRELLRVCILAPAIEETIYRIGLCSGVVLLLRTGGAIAASGLVFGLLHVLYGNPGPDNLIAGFFLAWAYFKSGSIVVPVMLHALGNLCALTAWVGLWWWYGV